MDSLTKEQHEETYNKIIRFYDFAESLIASVEQSNEEEAAKQLEFIEPLIDKIERATDTLAEEYRHFVKSGKKPGMLGRKRIEKSLQQIYDVLVTCTEVQFKQPLS